MVAADNKQSTDWVKIIGLVVTILVFLFGGGFFYNEVWRSKVLVYTVLPSYDLGEQSFAGLVVENRGRTPLTDIEIVVAGLGQNIQRLNISGAHETAEIVRGGEGEEGFAINMPRLSVGSSIAIYMVTSDVVDLDRPRTVLVTSAETTGIIDGSGSTVELIVAIMMLLASMTVTLTALLSRREGKKLLSEISAWEDQYSQMQPRVPHPLENDSSDQSTS